jgi:amylosucrase
LSYNPTLMALLWEALATRDTRVLEYAMERRFEIPEGCAWVNYVRSHDDIGWSFDDGDVRAVGFDPRAHRKFLTDFYTGRIENTFARGAMFQEDRVTGDARVSGTTASLAGVEHGIVEKDEEELDLAIRRVLLLHGVIMSIGGIPLIYLGDEIGMLNDYAYDTDPEKLGDSRWLHRFTFDWERAEERRDVESVPGRVYEGVRHLIQLRGQNKAFARGETEFVKTGNSHVLGYIRSNENGMVFLLANFTENRQSVEARRLRQMGMRKTMIDLYAGRTITAAQELILEPYQFMVLARVS